MSNKPNWLKSNILYIMGGIVVLAAISYWIGLYGLGE